METIRSRALAGALSVLVLASGCVGGKGMAGVVRRSALGTYPRESVALLVLEVKRTRDLHPGTAWFKEMAGLADRDQGVFAEVTRRLGPDVLTRLDRLSLAVVPREGTGVGYGILAEGTFDHAKVREALGNQDLLKLMEVGSADFSIANLPDGSLAFGPGQVLETMRANAASRGHGLDANPTMLAPLEKVRPEAQFWGAVDCRGLQRLFGAAPAPDLAGLSISLAPMQTLLTIAFRGTAAESVDIEIFGEADAKANAKTLADAVRGLVALGRIGAGREEAGEWLELLDGIGIDQQGDDVNLRVSIPAKTMEKLVGRMTSASKPAAEGPAEPAPPESSAGSPRSPAPTQATSERGGNPSRPSPEP